MSKIWVACNILNGIRIDENTVLLGPGKVEPKERKYGYALTQVDETTWKTWLAANEKTALVVGRMVLADQDANTLILTKCRRYGKSATTGFEQGARTGGGIAGTLPPVFKR
jgi:hypothetical protein